VFNLKKINIIIFSVFLILIFFVQGCSQSEIGKKLRGDLTAPQFAVRAPRFIVGCEDSDWGINLTEFGYVNCTYSDHYSRTFAIDLCSLNNESEIQEAYVENNGITWRHSYFDCPDGYVCYVVGNQYTNGARCMPEDQVEFECDDSDNGIDYYHFGIVETPENTHSDSCRPLWPDGEDEFELIEYYCIGNFLMSVYYECPNGCRNGRCIR